MAFKEEFAQPEVRVTEEKPDVFSLAGLIAWLETMPGAARYDYEDCSGACLLAQYLQHHNEWPKYDFCKAYGHMADIGGADVLQNSVAAPKPWTYGAALARARAAVRDGAK